MSFVWTVLGAGSILPRDGFGCAGYALRSAPDVGREVKGEGDSDARTRPSTEDARAFTLFDCGPGTLRALGTAGFDLRDLRRVVLTHFHPDHCLDLLALAFARRNPGLRSSLRHRWEIVGPVGLASWLERAATLFGDRGWTRFEDVDVTEVDPRRAGSLLRFDDSGHGVELSWCATRHTSDSLAWRVDAVHRDASGAPVRGASIAYTGDTGENADVAALARDVGLFVCECSFDDAHAVEHHLTPASAGRLAAAARCRALLLTHFYPGLDPEDARRGVAPAYLGRVELARDGSVHRVDA